MISIIELAILVLTAHYIADYGLQTRWMAKNKGKYWHVMLAHCFIWAGLVSVPLIWAGVFILPKFIFLFIGHYAMDSVKAYYYKSPKDLWMLIPDQTWHLFQCIIVVVM